MSWSNIYCLRFFDDTDCTVGIGTYLRMREIMLLHVQDHKENIYLNSYAAVTAKIDASFDAIAEQLQEEVHTIW